jgi:hypothetical protein
MTHECARQLLAAFDDADGITIWSRTYAHKLQRGQIGRGGVRNLLGIAPESTEFPQYSGGSTGEAPAGPVGLGNASLTGSRSPFQDGSLTAPTLFRFG